jgi:hypothetical protein
VGGPVRHAQYRQELADAVQAATGIPVTVDGPDDSTLPSIGVRWTLSQLSRGQAGGWNHAYEVEIRVGERNVDLDRLVATVSTAVAGWQPNTSNATASPPVVRPVQVIDGDISYPAVLASTTVTEPATD